MELRNLRAFAEVAAAGSLSRASAKLDTAQSALSRQLSTLEREVGGRLFHRTGRGVVLTELGERLVPRAQALLAEVAAFEEAARGGSGKPSGEVNLGIVPVAARNVVAALAGRLRDDYPGIRLRALEGFSGQVEEWLASGRVEIAIFNRYRRGKVRDAEPIMKADMVLIGKRGNAALKRPEIAFRSIAGVPLAMPVRPNSMTNLLVGLAASQHFELNVVIEAGSTPLIKEAILESDVCTISPRLVYARELASGEFSAAKIVRPAIVQTTWLALGPQRTLSAAAKVVARLVRELAAKR